MMSDEASLRSELNGLNKDLGEVKVSVGKIETSTTDSNRRLERIEDEISHDLKGIRQAMALLTSLKEKSDTHSAEIATLEKTKADQDDFMALKKRVDLMDDKVQQIMWRTLSVIGVAFLTYVAQKLGITIPGLK